ncbi:MAG: hypothetical protein H6619_05190 [Deltaproteobacteria bacterium]|nr:hypothetical protein [Deltaproteobacteria bacterium]
MLKAETYQVFTDTLNSLNVPYMVTGSVASIVYGEPRLTHDIDLVVLLKQSDVKNLIGSFPNSRFYVPPEEVINVELKRSSRGHFNIIDMETGFKADIYPIGKDPLQNWGIENKRAIDLNQSKLWIAPPEYVILSKLEYYREGGSQKHLIDIKNMLAISSEQVNFDILNKFVAERGLEKPWNELQIK